MLLLKKDTRSRAFSGCISVRGGAGWLLDGMADYSNRKGPPEALLLLEVMSTREWCGYIFMNPIDTVLPVGRTISQSAHLQLNQSTM